MIQSIFFSKKPSGGLGNRLFHFHFISQIAQELNLNYFYPRKLDAEFIQFKGISTGARHLLSRLENPIKVSNESILGLTKEEVRELFDSLLQEGRSIALEPPFLGESFFSSTFADPKLFFKNFIHQENNSEKYIAIHLRGGDFHSWNLAAILPTSFYVDALDSLFQSFPERDLTPIFVSTDDPSLQSFVELSRIYSKNIASYEQSIQVVAHTGMIGDFTQLANADALVSSPSTFSIWAGILGKSKKILHSKEWVEAMSIAGDPFWSKLALGGNDYYRAATLL